MTLMVNVLKTAVEDLLDGHRLTVADAIDRHFAPTFRQCVDGRWHDLATFSASITALRDAVRHVRFDVIDEIADGDRYAERHIIELIRHDGGRVAQEVYVFARRDADGRFLIIEEVSLPIDR